MRLKTLTRLLLLLGLFVSLLYHPPRLLPTTAAPQENPVIQVFETSLNPDGNAYEINPGPDGTLWISDNLAGEIRAYAPDGSTLRIYSGLGTVSDARASSDNLVWYVDQATRQLGRLDPVKHELTYWQLPPGEASGFGTNLGEEGVVWISDFSQALVFRFDPVTSEMCTYDTSQLTISGSPYLVYEGGALWFTDFYNNALLRLDPHSGLVTQWKLVTFGWDFEAEGLTGDGAGGIWFADSNTGSLGHLDLSNPDAPLLRRYLIPSGGGQPSMLTRQASVVWYSAWIQPLVGLLNPADAYSTTYTPQVNYETLTPSCETLTNSPVQPVLFANRTPSWTPVSYELHSLSSGWTAITLGEESYPWGLAIQDNFIWAVDNGRSMLLRSEINVSVTACTLHDEDGNLETSTDQTPLEGETVYLRVDGNRQEPAQITQADGCYTWQNLTPSLHYGLELVNMNQWEVLSLAEMNFDPALPGEALHYHFVVGTPSLSIHLPLVSR